MADRRRDTVLINGEWRPTSHTHPVENPATEQVIGTAAVAETEHVQQAVDAARRAFPRWSALPAADRGQYLSRMYDHLLANRQQVIDTIVAEVGCPVRVTESEQVDLALQVLRYYADLAATLPEGPDSRIGHSLIFREPVGVVGTITPWNYPLYQLILKAAPALAAGCTVVAKPAELAPLSAYLWTDAAVAAGLPDGVFNLVPGPGRVVGEAIADHPDVDLVSFTGSTAVGARVAATAARTITRVALELGGKSASVLLDDADLAEAVDTTVTAATLNSGQTCSAWTRLLVPHSSYPEAWELACAAAAKLVVGDPTAPRTDLGPLISRPQLEAVQAMVHRARDTGARIFQGDTPDGTGHFHPVTVIGEVSPDAEIVREEVFGPVLVIVPYQDVDDAVRLANDTRYGLTGAVWGRDTDRALAVARRLRTGQVDVNGAPFNIEAPFGGYGHSGYGRELGRFGLEEFTELKAVQV
ncbi:MAG: aldehyde dehydrogenase family protein [Propionibacteriaceae bacterium]|nr:aldehyde dehydrogenase family protein [Propionibacteriaceae bacterium]